MLLTNNIQSGGQLYCQLLLVLNISNEVAKNKYWEEALFVM